MTDSSAKRIFSDTSITSQLACFQKAHRETAVFRTRLNSKPDRFQQAFAKQNQKKHLNLLPITLLKTGITWTVHQKKSC